MSALIAVESCVGNTRWIASASATCCEPGGSSRRSWTARKPRQSCPGLDDDAERTRR